MAKNKAALARFVNAVSGRNSVLVNAGSVASASTVSSEPSSLLRLVNAVSGRKMEFVDTASVASASTITSDPSNSVQNGEFSVTTPIMKEQREEPRKTSANSLGLSKLRDQFTKLVSPTKTSKKKIGGRSSLRSILSPRVQSPMYSPSPHTGSLPNSYHSPDGDVSTSSENRALFSPTKRRDTANMIDMIDKQELVRRLGTSNIDTCRTIKDKEPMEREEFMDILDGVSPKRTRQSLSGSGISEQGRHNDTVMECY